MVIKPYRRLELTHRPTTVLDVGDFDAVLAAGPWNLSICDRKWYASRKFRRDDGTYVTQYLHTFLTGWPLVDHIDGDGLNNRRGNLRPATGSQNNANSTQSRKSASGLRGVSYFHRTSRWRAHITFESKQRHLGYFHSAEDAARAYDAAARELFGEFARPNFPEGENA